MTDNSKPDAKASKKKAPAKKKAPSAKRQRQHMDNETFERLEAKGLDNLPRKEKLALITERKRRLAAEQKAIREEMDANKEERAAARKERAEARKSVMTEKQALHKLSTSVADTVKRGDTDELSQLADDLMEAATNTASQLRKFAKVLDSLDDL